MSEEKKEPEFMKWHEDGYITLTVNDAITITTSKPVTPEEWRGHKGEAAWDCDYWNFTEEEVKYLLSLEWLV